MLYPVLPVFLKSIGFSIVLIGILEGFAEAIAGLSKGYFGRLSDNSGKRAPFVQAGYALSAISKPMMAMFVYPLWIFFARTIDRIGKGIRTGARDALLSQEATPSTKGRIFGFHRSMDTIGAVLGPSLALFYLWKYPGDYATMFYLAFIPGVLATTMTFFLREKKQEPSKKSNAGLFEIFRYWNKSPVLYKKVAGGLLVFALVNTSDVFLLLKMKESGISDTFVIGIYIFYNLIYALASYPAGIIGDRIGIRSMLIVGLIVFSFVYAMMGFTNSMTVYFVLFFLYGIYAAASEGISKALLSNLVKKEDMATALGSFSGLQSLCLLVASSTAGLIWMYIGMNATFLFSAFITLCVVFYLAFFVRIPRIVHN